MPGTSAIRRISGYGILFGMFRTYNARTRIKSIVSLNLVKRLLHLKIRKAPSLSLLPDVLRSGDQSIPLIG